MLNPSFQLHSPNHELSFELFFFGPNQLIFPPKWCHVGLASIGQFLVLSPRLKAMGPIIDSQPIGLLYFIGPWTLDPHLMWPLYYILPHAIASSSQEFPWFILIHTTGLRPAGGPHFTLALFQ